MGYEPLDTFKEIAENSYQAVIIASKRARQLNNIRLAKLEMLSSENADRIEIDGRKVTALALKDCTEGKVRFQKADGEKPTDS